MYGCDATTLFAIKSLMKTTPTQLNTIFLFLLIFWFAEAVRICEKPLSRVVNEMPFNYVNSVWSVILTMTTVGYGDIYPRTLLGRIVMFFCSIFGVIVVSLIVVTVQNSLELSNVESKAHTVIKKIQLTEKMRDRAAMVIGKASRIFLEVKDKLPIQTTQIFEYSNSVRYFKDSRR